MTTAVAAPPRKFMPTAVHNLLTTWGLTVFVAAFSLIAIAPLMPAPITAETNTGDSQVTTVGWIIMGSLAGAFVAFGGLAARGSAKGSRKGLGLLKLGSLVGMGVGGLIFAAILASTFMSKKSVLGPDDVMLFRLMVGLLIFGLPFLPIVFSFATFRMARKEEVLDFFTVEEEAEVITEEDAVEAGTEAIEPSAEEEPVSYEEPETVAYEGDLSEEPAAIAEDDFMSDLGEGEAVAEKESIHEEAIPEEAVGDSIHDAEPSALLDEEAPVEDEPIAEAVDEAAAVTEIADETVAEEPEETGAKPKKKKKEKKPRVKGKGLSPTAKIILVGGSAAAMVAVLSPFVGLSFVPGAVEKGGTTIVGWGIWLAVMVFALGGATWLALSIRKRSKLASTDVFSRSPHASVETDDLAVSEVVEEEYAAEPVADEIVSGEPGTAEDSALETAEEEALQVPTEETDAVEAVDESAFGVEEDLVGDEVTAVEEPAVEEEAAIADAVIEDEALAVEEPIAEGAPTDKAKKKKAKKPIGAGTKVAGVMLLGVTVAGASYFLVGSIGGLFGWITFGVVALISLAGTAFWSRNILKRSRTVPPVADESADVGEALLPRQIDADAEMAVESVDEALLPRELDADAEVIIEADEPAAVEEEPIEAKADEDDWLADLETTEEVPTTTESAADEPAAPLIAEVIPEFENLADEVAPSLIEDESTQPEVIEESQPAAFDLEDSSFSRSPQASVESAESIIEEEIADESFTETKPPSDLDIVTDTLRAAAEQGEAPAPKKKPKKAGKWLFGLLKRKQASTPSSAPPVEEEAVIAEEVVDEIPTISEDAELALEEEPAVVEEASPVIGESAIEETSAPAVAEDEEDDDWPILEVTPSPSAVGRALLDEPESGLDQLESALRDAAALTPAPQPKKKSPAVKLTALWLVSTAILAGLFALPMFVALAPFTRSGAFTTEGWLLFAAVGSTLLVIDLLITVLSLRQPRRKPVRPSAVVMAQLADEPEADEAIIAEEVVTEEDEAPEIAEAVIEDSVVEEPVIEEPVALAEPKPPVTPPLAPPFRRSVPDMHPVSAHDAARSLLDFIFEEKARQLDEIEAQSQRPATPPTPAPEEPVAEAPSEPEPTLDMTLPEVEESSTDWQSVLPPEPSSDMTLPEELGIAEAQSQEPEPLLEMTLPDIVEPEPEPSRPSAIAEELRHEVEQEEAVLADAEPKLSPEITPMRPQDPARSLLDFVLEEDEDKPKE